MSYIPMHEFDRDPDLDRENLLAQVAARALRINSELLARQDGPGERSGPHDIAGPATTSAPPVGRRSKARR